MSIMRPEFRHGSLLQIGKQRGFGLVAAMFLIIIVAGAIAAMWRMSVTQNATTSLAIQQARAYQAARAGIEWGVAQALIARTCKHDNPPFQVDGFAVEVVCIPSDVNGQWGSGSPDLPEEGLDGVIFYSVTSEAESSSGGPDHAYRRLRAVIEHATADQSGETEED